MDITFLKALLKSRADDFQSSIVRSKSIEVFKDTYSTDERYLRFRMSVNDMLASEGLKPYYGVPGVAPSNAHIADVPPGNPEGPRSYEFKPSFITQLKKCFKPQRIVRIAKDTSSGLPERAKDRPTKLGIYNLAKSMPYSIIKEHSVLFSRYSAFRMQMNDAFGRVREALTYKIVANKDGTEKPVIEKILLDPKRRGLAEFGLQAYRLRLPSGFSLWRNAGWISSLQATHLSELAWVPSQASKAAARIRAFIRRPHSVFIEIISGDGTAQETKFDPRSARDICEIYGMSERFIDFFCPTLIHTNHIISSYNGLNSGSSVVQIANTYETLGRLESCGLNISALLNADGELEDELLFAGGDAFLYMGPEEKVKAIREVYPTTASKIDETPRMLNRDVLILKDEVYLMQDLSKRVGNQVAPELSVEDRPYAHYGSNQAWTSFDINKLNIDVVKSVYQKLNKLMSAFGMKEPDETPPSPGFVLDKGKILDDPELLEKYGYIHFDDALAYYPNEQCELLFHFKDVINQINLESRKENK